ncbi:MAG: hypothetical protein GPOALKHO_001106 [Sodalis sp.]|nr:MAG: hypothetical protein GPOALKHO_001106 [Sodalis sp.]
MRLETVMSLPVFLAINVMLATLLVRNATYKNAICRDVSRRRRLRKDDRMTGCSQTLRTQPYNRTSACALAHGIGSLFGRGRQTGCARRAPGWNVDW